LLDLCSSKNYKYEFIIIPIFPLIERLVSFQRCPKFFLFILFWLVFIYSSSPQIEFMCWTKCHPFVSVTRWCCFKQLLSYQCSFTKGWRRLQICEISLQVVYYLYLGWLIHAKPFPSNEWNLKNYHIFLSTKRENQEKQLSSKIILCSI